MLRKIFTLSVFSFVVFCSLVRAQECQPPAIVANAKSVNLFSPEQEMILGELTFERMSGEIRLVKDEELQAYVDRLGERLIKYLPPMGLKFKFHIMDISDANAYNIPGGHVFLSRKLIGFVSSEDELVGVMAHELGHATVRHGAVDMSTRLRKVLGVTTLGDRKDIAEKYNLLIEKARTKSVPQRNNHEDNQQLEADAIGLRAMTAAGYDPNAFYAFFSRLTESKAKGGGWFSDFFGNASPNEKRLREMTEATTALPLACREKRVAKTTEEFLKWQADVVLFRNAERKEALPGLIWKRELATKLRSDISRIIVSRDGKYVVTRDDFSITVLEREPLAVAFQIPVENADDVYITPDDKHVVFTTRSLRFEKWNIAERKPIEVRELVLRNQCWESRLSPDGNFLACAASSANSLMEPTADLHVIDTRTGKRIYEKKGFYQPNYYEYMGWYYSFEDSERERSFFRIEFSPDARVVLFSRSNFFRSNVRGGWSQGFTGVTQKTALALDLTTLKPIETSDVFKSVASRAYAFLDAQRVIGQPSDDPQDGGVFSFPDGKRLQKFPFYAREIRTTGKPDFVVVEPLENSKMGAFDVKNMHIVAGMNKEDAAVWEDLFIYESVSGRIVIREMKGAGKEKVLAEKELASIEIPAAAIGNLSAAQISNNFEWLLLSSKTRGGLWNTAGGERKVFTRGFRGGIVADDGNAVGEFPKWEASPHALALLNPKTEQVAVIGGLPESGARQFGRFVLTRSSLKKEKPDTKDDEKKNAPTVPVFDDRDANLREDVRFELKDFVQNKVIWSRDFTRRAPGYSFDAYSGRLMFYWYLGSEAGKAALRENRELREKAAALDNLEDDYLIEVIDAFAGKTIGTLPLETGRGSFYVGGGMSEGDWLVLYDSADRVLVYSLSTGELRHRFFGNHAAINPARRQVAVENFPGEVSIYNLETGDRQANFIINGNAAFVRFNLEGNKLFVLSDAQAAYAFDLNKIANPAPKRLE